MKKVRFATLFARSKHRGEGERDKNKAEEEKNLAGMICGSTLRADHACL